MEKYGKILNLSHKLDLLGETMVLMSADVYGKLYNDIMGEQRDYTLAATLVRDAAVEFESGLNWVDNDNRDYLAELEAFEEKKLKEWKKMYS